MAKNKAAKPAKHSFHIATEPHTVRVTDDFTHHHEVYATTGDLAAYKAMLDAVVVDRDDLIKLEEQAARYTAAADVL